MPSQVRLCKVWQLPHSELAWICCNRGVTLRKGFQISGPQRPHSARGEPKSMCFPSQQGPTCSSHIALHWGQVPGPLPPHLTLTAAWQGRVNPHSHFTYENTEALTSSMPSRGRNDSHSSCPLPRGSAMWVHGDIIAPLEGGGIMPRAGTPLILCTSPTSPLQGPWKQLEAGRFRGKNIRQGPETYIQGYLPLGQVPHLPEP